MTSDPIGRIIKQWADDGFGATISINTITPAGKTVCSVRVTSPDRYIGKTAGSAYGDDPVSCIQQAHVEVLQYTERNRLPNGKWRAVAAPADEEEPE